MSLIIVTRREARRKCFILVADFNYLFFKLSRYRNVMRLRAQTGSPWQFRQRDSSERG